MEKWAHNITHKLADGVKHLDLDGSSSNDSAVGQTYEIRGRRYRIARLLAEGMRFNTAITYLSLKAALLLYFWVKIQPRVRRWL